MITSLSAFSYFLIVFLMSNNYVLPGSIIREFVILDNWKDIPCNLYLKAIYFANPPPKECPTNI